MRLQTQIFLVFGSVFVLLFGAVEYYHYRELREAEVAQTLDEANAIAGVLMATRRVYHHQFIASELPLNDKTIGFLPAHAMQRISREFLNFVTSGLSFNNVSDRARNPHNAADKVELEAIAFFRNHPDAQERMVPFSAANGQNFYHYSRPLWIEQYCLKCHGKRADAPPTIQERYDEGFDYKLGDLRGILSIKLPAAELEARTLSRFKEDTTARLIAFGASFLLLFWLLESGIVRRLQRLKEAAARLQGGDYQARAGLKGNDEVHDLSVAFDAMADAIASREQRLVEGEARYRAVFEQAGEPIMLIDPTTTRLVEFNDATCTVFRHSRDELHGMRITDFDDDASRALVGPRLAQLQGGGEHMFESRIRAGDGQLRDLRIRARMVSLEGRAYVLALVRDITTELENSQAVAKERTFLQNIIDGAVDPIMVIGTDYRVLTMNRAARTFLDREPDGGVLLCHQLSHHSDTPCSGAGHPCPLQQVQRTLAPVTMVHEHCRADGSKRLFQLEATPLLDDDGNFRGIIETSRDITDKVRAEEQLRMVSQAVEQSPVSVIITDLNGRIEYANRKFEEVSGYALPEVIGQNPRILKTGYTTDAEYHELWQTIMQGKTWWGEFLNRRKNGEQYWEYASISPMFDTSGRITHFLGVKEDITVRKEYEERLLHQENFDALTDLPNRVLALDRLGQILARALREERHVGLLLLDLDDFKTVNDSLGHSVGDELLKRVANRLKSTVRPGDTVARLGSDEFLLILADMMVATDAQRVTEKVRAAFTQPFVIEGVELYVTPSVGISVAPADAQEGHVLLRNADAAMHRAKESGRNRMQFFTPGMNERAVQRLEMESLLRQALERQELVLHFQPLVVSGSGRLVGAEALLRWQSRELGLVAPDRFIPLAEETGLIVPIGEWVLRTACTAVAEWAGQGVQLHVAVNVSPRQFRESGLVEMVAAILEETGVAPEWLELEVTESLLLEDAPSIMEQLQALKGLGVRLVLDDFGTGYSSLSYLKRYPFDALKIDRSFVADVNHDADDAALCQAIVHMAHTLNLKVVAEGVEVAEQLELLTAYGADFVQGFYFSRPVDAARFADFVKRARL